MATECGNRSHSAAFPESLPEWFIKLFTTEGDTVLDPFSGSGTTLKVAKAMKRNAVGIEILDEYCEITANRVGLKKSSQKNTGIQMIESRIISDFIESCIDEEFHQKNKKNKGDKIIRYNKKKNPYLFKAKGLTSASDLIKSIMDATVSSGEETVLAISWKRLQSSHVPKHLVEENPVR